MFCVTFCPVFPQGLWLYSSIWDPVYHHVSSAGRNRSKAGGVICNYTNLPIVTKSQEKDETTTELIQLASFVGQNSSLPQNQDININTQF